MAIDIQGAVQLQGSVDWQASTTPSGGTSGGVTFDGTECLVDDGTEHTPLAPPSLPPQHPVVQNHSSAKVKLAYNPNNSGHTINNKPIISTGSLWLQHYNDIAGQPITGIGSANAKAIVPIMLKTDGEASVGALNGVGFTV